MTPVTRWRGEIAAPRVALCGMHQGMHSGLLGGGGARRWWIFRLFLVSIFRLFSHGSGRVIATPPSHIFIMIL